MAESRAIAYRALHGVGDATLGEWEERGNGKIVHVRRRCSEGEALIVGPVRDIRDTPEEQERLRELFHDVPQLRSVFS